MNTTNNRSTLIAERLTLDVQDGKHKRRILNDVSFTVNGGEVVGVTGPSGSGKSTLLAVAGCLQEPTAGSAALRTGDTTIDLASARGQRAAQIRRDHLGIVFQQPSLLPSLTVEEQLLLMLNLSKVFRFGARATKRAEKEMTRQLLEAVGLGDKLKAKTSELSGGQQARVNLARAFMNNPALLLVDEPTAALDTKAATQVTELIKDLAHDRNVPALYVSHDQDQLETLDRTMTMVDGALREPALATS